MVYKSPKLQDPNVIGGAAGGESRADCARNGIGLRFSETAKRLGLRTSKLSTYLSIAYMYPGAAALYSTWDVVYGPVCTVVWQGSVGDRRPYADLVSANRKLSRRIIFLAIALTHSSLRWQSGLVPVKTRIRPLILNTDRRSERAWFIVVPGIRTSKECPWLPTILME